MTKVPVKVLRTIGDFGGLPIGTRIATNHNKLLMLESAMGSIYWYEQGELQPYIPLVHWLPAYVLPPAVDHKSDDKWPGEAIEMHAAEQTIKKVLGHDDWCKDGCWLQKTRATNADPA